MTLEVRQQFVSDAIARVDQVRVRHVFTPGLAATFELSAKLRPRRPENRPHATSSTGCDCRHTAQTCASQDAEQQSFRLIVFGVRGRDAIRPARPLEIVQESVPGRSARDFQRLLRLARLCRHVYAGGHKGQPEFRSQGCAKRFIKV